MTIAETHRPFDPDGAAVVARLGGFVPGVFW